MLLRSMAFTYLAAVQVPLLPYKTRPLLLLVDGRSPSSGLMRSSAVFLQAPAELAPAVVAIA